MTKKTINIGQTANDRKGDSLRAAFGKVNDNFSELYTALGLNSGGLNIAAFEFTGSTISTTDSSAIVIDQATTVTSNLTVGGDLLPSVANGGDLGSSAKPWRSLYVSNSTIYLGNTAIAVNQSGQLTVGGSGVTAGSVAWANVTGKPTIPTGDRLVNGTDKIVLNQEGTTRLSMYLNNVEKTRIQQNGNDLLLSSLSGGVVLAATDGTNGEWRFKNNGELESAQGSYLSSAEVQATFGSMDSLLAGASSGTVTLKSGTGAVDGGSIYIQAGTGGSGNDGEVVIRTGSGPYEWLFDNGGILTVPGAITLGTDARIYGLGDFIGLLASPSSSAGLEIDGVNDAILAAERHVVIRSDSGTTNNNWTFNENGTLTAPGDIIATGHVGEFGTVNANYLGHVGQSQIQIGDGNLANGQSIVITDQRVRIMAAVPATSIGSSGDYIGSVAFNSSYIYYCTANYNGVNNIWKRVAWSGDTW